MKLTEILEALEKPKQIYNPGFDPEDTPRKSTEILPSGEVVYRDAKHVNNAFIDARKRLKAYQEKNPGKLKEYDQIFKAVNKIISLIDKVND